MTQILDSFDFEHRGRKFRAFIMEDTDSGPPWERNDGHGVVSAWETRDKRPGEWVLNNDRLSKRYYDFAATLKIAKKEWGLSNEDKEALAVKLGHYPSPNECAVEAVRKDYEYLHGWCNDEWQYVGVCIQALDDDSDPLGDKYAHALWGIESDEVDYRKVVAADLADEWFHTAPPLEKLRPYVMVEDKDLGLLELAQLVLDRVKEDLATKGTSACPTNSHDPS